MCGGNSFIWMDERSQIPDLNASPPSPPPPQLSFKTIFFSTGCISLVHATDARRMPTAVNPFSVHANDCYKQWCVEAETAKESVTSRIYQISMWGEHPIKNVVSDDNYWWGVGDRIQSKNVKGIGPGYRVSACHWL